MEKNPLSFQLKLNPDDFLPATDEEKEGLVVMRDSVSFWKMVSDVCVRTKWLWFVCLSLLLL